jgi:hypothetical protein
LDDDNLARGFGLLIAYVLPGFVTLVGLGWTSDAVQLWLIGASNAGPTVGSFFYVFMASVGAGMVASLVRWACLDTLHHMTGLDRPVLDESRLVERLPAFDYLVEQHYRYYQFYGNTMVATILAFVLWRTSPTGAATAVGWAEFGLVVLVSLFVAGSRDALRKYYAGGEMVLGRSQRRRAVTNGKHPDRLSKLEAKPQQSRPHPQPAKEVSHTAGTTKPAVVAPDRKSSVG